MSSTFTQYNLVRENYGRLIQQQTKRAEVQREIDYFVQNIKNVETPEDLIEDSRLYRFTLTAFGLESQIFAKGLIKKLLEEGTDSPFDLANKMSDKRFKDLAVATGFAEFGDAKVKSPQFAQAVVKKFIQISIEQEQGEQNSGVQLALYFERQAPRIKNWFAVFADRALMEVMRVSLGLPQEVFTQDLDRLAVKLEKRFDLEKLQDPQELQKFLKRFTLLQDLEQGGAGGSLPGIANDRIALFKPIGPAGQNAILNIPPINVRGF